jgi:hypothetical protein
VSEEPVDDPTPDDDDVEELPPLSVLVDMLGDAVKLLEGVDDLIAAHRRTAGEDHHLIARMHDASFRVGQAWAATVSARRALRSDHG